MENQPLIVENLLISPKIHVENRESALWKGWKAACGAAFSTGFAAVEIFPQKGEAISPERFLPVHAAVRLRACRASGEAPGEKSPRKRRGHEVKEGRSAAKVTNFV